MYGRPDRVGLWLQHMVQTPSARCYNLTFSCDQDTQVWKITSERAEYVIPCTLYMQWCAHANCNKRSSHTTTKPVRNLWTMCFALKRLSRWRVSLTTFALSCHLEVVPALSQKAAHLHLPFPRVFGCSLQYVCKQLNLYWCGEDGQCPSLSPKSDTGARSTKLASSNSSTPSKYAVRGNEKHLPCLWGVECSC